MPLSPHLSIYRPQMTSFSSIFGRICGVYTYFSIVALIWSAIFSMYKTGDALHSVGLIVAVMHSQNSLVMLASNVIFYASIFAYTFYFLAIVRHILWDFSICLDVKPAKRLGWAMFIVAFAVTAFVFAM